MLSASVIFFVLAVLAFIAGAFNFSQKMTAVNWVSLGLALALLGFIVRG